ncbi:MAG: AsmA-like C-terminal region-containing protein [Myxococcales bacterium]
MHSPSSPDSPKARRATPRCPSRTCGCAARASSSAGRRRSTWPGARRASTCPVRCSTSTRCWRPCHRRSRSPRRAPARAHRCRNRCATRIRSVTALGQIRADRMVVKKLVSQHVTAEARLQGGVLTLSRADADLYGGTLDASGTRLDLTQPQPSWLLSARLGGVDFGNAMQLVSGASPLTGRFSGQIHLSGSGDVWQQLLTSLNGKGSFKLENGKLTTASLEQTMAQPLAEALRVAGVLQQLARGGSGAGVAPPAAGTELRDLAGSFTLENGLLRFAKPVTVQSSFGELSVGGAIGLDQRLDLKGTAKLSPQFVARATGLAAPKQPLDAPLQIGGTLGAPQVSVDSAALARAAAQGLAPSQPNPEDLLRKGLKGFTPGP